MEASLLDVANLVQSCIRCPLGHIRNQTGCKSTPGNGLTTKVKLAFVGEAPGKEESLSGLPFVGQAGKLFDRMIQVCLGLARDDVFVTNVVKCRPPNNRQPTENEINACFSYLDAQLKFLKPKVIVTLGAIATKALLGSEEPISKLRGNIFHTIYGNIVPTYHPAYLLRVPGAKVLCTEDMKLVKNILIGT